MYAARALICYIVSLISSFTINHGMEKRKNLGSEQNISSKVLHYIADANIGKWLKAD